MSESVKFDRAAEYYDETRGYPPGADTAVSALIAQAGRFAPHSSILEVGIGTGRVSLPLAPHVGSITGIDLSRPMMGKLRKKQNGEPIMLVEGDATRLPFAAQQFDGAVASHIFHLIPAWQQALAEVGRVLKPGAALISIWADEHNTFATLWDAWNRVVPHNPERVAGVDWRKQPNFIQDAGWQPMGDKLQHRYERTITPGTFMDQVRRRVWSMCWRFSDDDMAVGIPAMEAAIAEHYGSMDTIIHLDARIYVQAYLPPA
ncbi:MAG: class I SAM-dependent methyltransferase [Anaerolineae bacterium]|nr:class I SAM-dependent methyltransferase [Anaerolineae bacterium]